jgi:hypothetical protein
MDVSGSGFTIGTPIITTGGPPPADSGPGFQESLEAAATRAADFSPTERATYVRAMVSRSLEMKVGGRTVADVRVALPEFGRDYPHLLEMLFQPSFDPQNLQTMLHMLDRMGQGSLTQHQASVIVGQRVFEKAKK